MKSYTLLALIAATMASTTEAIKLKSDADTLSRIETKIDAIVTKVGATVPAGASGATQSGDGDIVDGAFDALSGAQDDGTLGAAAGIAANVAAPGTGVIATHLVNEHGDEAIDGARDVVG